MTLAGSQAPTQFFAYSLAVGCGRELEGQKQEKLTDQD